MLKGWACEVGLAGAGITLNLNTNTNMKTAYSHRGPSRVP